MRKNIARILAAFAVGERATEKSCSTDGEVLYSYNTPIAWKGPDGWVKVAETKYSATTTVQQNAARYYFGQTGRLACNAHEECQVSWEMAIACAKGEP